MNTSPSLHFPSFSMETLSAVSFLNTRLNCIHRFGKVVYALFCGYKVNIDTNCETHIMDNLEKMKGTHWYHKYDDIRSAQSEYKINKPPPTQT